jgi:drug/metabolite transporter (DMT)-like permease
VSAAAGNWRLGLIFAGITTLAWGLLPIALKAMLAYMDPFTITWYRFLAAAVIAGLLLTATGRLPRLGRLDVAGRVLMVVAVVGLIGNYVFYLLGLDYASPGTTQVLMQLAPLFLLLGGVLFLGESFAPLQWLGFAALVGGLPLFFHARLGELMLLDGDFARGTGLILLSALVWTSYALAQKLLLRYLTAQGILLVIYVAASVALLPTSAPAAVGDLTAWPVALLVFCSLNTVIAYGAFGEAMSHWDASRVSAVIALSPLLTLLFGWLLGRLPTGYVNIDQIDALSVVGALLVVSGSALCALGGARGAPPAPYDGPPGETKESQP